MGTGGQTAPKRRSARTPSRRVRITPAITPGRPTSTTTRSRTSSTLRFSPAASVSRSRRRLLDTISPRTRPTASSTSLTSVAWPGCSVLPARRLPHPRPRLLLPLPHQRRRLPLHRRPRRPRRLLLASPQHQRQLLRPADTHRYTNGDTHTDSDADRHTDGNGHANS